MSLAHVVATVQAHLTAHWDRCPVRGLNEADARTAKDKAPFLEVQFPVADSEQISTGVPGSNTYRDTGALRFVLGVPRGRGLVGFLPWIEELRGLFRGRNLDGVRFYAPSPPVTDDRNDDGSYFLLTFAVPFEHDDLG